MPRPASRTATPTTPSRAQPSTPISPPSGEYLIALESRLASTCLRRFGSPSVTSGSARARPALERSAPRLGDPLEVEEVGDELGQAPRLLVHRLEMRAADLGLGV